MRDKIRDELPSLFRLFQADAYLVKKIVASAGALFEEVLADQNHPLRHEFDRFVIGFIETLRDSPDYAERAEQLKRDLLSRPELGSLADEIWKSLREFIEQDLRSEGSRTREHLAGLFVDVGRQLAADPQVRADMNEGFVVALSSFVESQKSGVSTLRRRPGEALGSRPAHPADRAQYRPRPAIHPLQRHADRRARRAGAVFAPSFSSLRIDARRRR